jgi:hypothetical protein
MRFTQSLQRVSFGKGRRRTAGGQEVVAVWLRDESGAVAAITAICLVVFIAILALVLDIGHLASVRSELQNAADASALAGARSLNPTASPGNNLTPFTGNPNCTGAVNAAMTLTNQSDSRDLAIGLADIQLGHWGWPGENPPFPLNQFVPLGACSINVNAISVTARRDQNLNQPMPTWFARLLGIDTINVTSRAAIGALGYVNGVVAGRAFPIAINQAWLLRQLRQKVPTGGIQFNPDGGDNGGWDSPLDQSPTGANLNNWISQGFPEQLSRDNLINLNNGVIDSAMQEIKNQLPNHLQSYTLSDGTTYTGWMVLAPVVTVDKFNRNTTVVSFQAMIILDVNAQGQTKTLQVVFFNGPVLVGGGIPGGPSSNLFATLPRLVQ